MTSKFPFYLPKNPWQQSFWLRILVNIRGFLLALFIFIPLLVINLIQMMSIVIRIFSMSIFRRFNWFLADRYWSFLVFMTEKFNGIEINVVGDKLPSNENALVISNHQNIADIPVILSLAGRHNRLGDLKWFVKDIIKYVPGPGWGVVFLDSVFLKRNWADDKEKIEKTFQNITKNRLRFWLISFLEGTRITPEKLKQSQEYARSRGLPDTEYVMIPRTKGFLAAVAGLGDQLDAVYSITLAYPNGIPSLWQLVLGDVKKIAIDVVRTPVSALPRDEKELENWALQAFVLKDQKLRNFFATGHFSDQSRLSPSLGYASTQEVLAYR